MSELKAVSGNCFVVRDKQEADFEGIDLSDTVQVKSSYGTIKAVDGTCSFAKYGDRVHIPHYGVMDIEFDGEEYALFKADRLFFINGEPVNQNVLVRKCTEDHVRDESGEIALYMTENHIENTNWVEVIESAADCRYIKPEHRGLYCPLPESDEKLARIGHSKEFCVHESLIKMLTEG